MIRLGLPARLGLAVVTCVVALPLGVGAQPSDDLALARRVVEAVRQATARALPYPRTNDDGDQPASGAADPKWMVFAPAVEAADLPGARPGALTAVEVKANPLNTDNQAIFNKADAEMQRAVMAVQKRTQDSYDRALAEFQRSGRASAVDTPTLDDDGVVGARLDADMHLTIGVRVNAPVYALEVTAAEPPSTAAPPAGAAVLVRAPQGVIKDASSSADRFHPAEAHLWFGPVQPPVVSRTSSDVFAVTVQASAPGAAGGAQVRSALVTLTGNAALIDQVLAQADWTVLARLLASQ
jgi:hypothetical protein